MVGTHGKLDSLGRYLEDPLPERNLGVGGEFGVQVEITGYPSGCIHYPLRASLHGDGRVRAYLNIIDLIELKFVSTGKECAVGARFYQNRCWTRGANAGSL